MLSMSSASRCEAPRGGGPRREPGARLEPFPDQSQSAPVPGIEHLVQGTVLEVLGQQPREAVGREVDLLEQERLARGDAQPLDVQGRLTHGHLEALRRPARRRPRDAPRPPGSLDSRPRRCISSVKLRALLRSTSTGGWTTKVPRPRVRSSRRSRVSSVIRSANGDQAAPVAAGELALGRQAIARPPLASDRARHADRDRPGGAAGRGRVAGRKRAILRRCLSPRDAVRQRSSRRLLIML